LIPVFNPSDPLQIMFIKQIPYRFFLFFFFVMNSPAPAQTNPALFLARADGQTTISVTGPAGTFCQVRSVPNLNPLTAWLAQTNLSLSYLPSVVADASAASVAQRFYRVQVMPHATNYQPTWASVDRHPPAPEWFQDAKFGIYFHFGVFSVPAYGSEWYPRNMYNTGEGAYNHHVATYGNPFSNWPYNNFINGAYDATGKNWIQFAPKLISQGGKLDPDAWAQLFLNAGAKFAGPVAEHHDGFSMWNSAVNEWNSVGKEPHFDMALQWATAIRTHGLKLLMAMHHAYNFNGYYQYAPSQTDPSLKKLYGQLDTAAENQLWYDKLREIVDFYQPDIIWEDFEVSLVQEPQRLNFLSYYYNRALDWNREVVATYKDGFNTNGEVFDYERGGPAGLQYPYWLTDDSVSSSSWCYTVGMGYYSTNAMLDALIDRVSKNGNMLLNIAPMADGTIPQAQQNILLGMGSWLGKFGESIYATRAWSAYGEGPTAMGGGSFTTPVAGTATDIRFTRNKATNVLYAIVMGWPGNGAQLKIATLNTVNINLASLTNVSLIVNSNSYLNLAYAQDANALNVSMPASQPFTAIAYAFKLSFSGQIPSLTPIPTAYTPTFYQDFNYSNTAVSLDPGLYTSSQLQGAGIPNDSISSMIIPLGFKVIGYSGDNFTGTAWMFTNNVASLIPLGANDAITSLAVTFDTNAIFKIVSLANVMVVDNGNTATAGAAVIQWGANGGTPQQWQFVDAGSGYFKVVSVKSGMVLDCGGSLTAGATNVVQQVWTGSSNQQWQVISSGGGYFRIANRTSGLVFDSGGSVAQGSVLKQWTWSGSGNLLWQLVKVN
jgi:alpha-L-fucosidase